MSVKQKQKRKPGGGFKNQGEFWNWKADAGKMDVRTPFDRKSLIQNQKRCISVKPAISPRRVRRGV